MVKLTLCVANCGELMKLDHISDQYSVDKVDSACETPTNPTTL